MSDMHVDSFYKYLIENGYYFDKELIENYLLSLKVKPFVILTGNSGTGKTKLSQLYAKFLRDSDYHWIKVTTKARSWGYSEKKKIDGKDCGWSISPRYMEDIIPYQAKKSYEIEVGGHVSTAEIKVFSQVYYDKHNDKLKDYFKELYLSERSQIREDKERGVSHEDQLVDLGISYKDLCSILFNDFVESNDFSFQMNSIDSFLTKPKGDVILSNFIYKYSPLDNAVNCTVLASNIYADAKFI